MGKRVGLVPALTAAVTICAFGSVHEVSSPSGNNKVRIELSDRITYSVFSLGKEIILPSPVSMSLADGTVLGRTPRLKEVRERRLDERITPVVKVKRALVVDRGNELSLEFEGNYSLTARAYDDGVAYRFSTRLGGEVTVAREEATFRFPGNHRAFMPITDTMFLSFEKKYVYKAIAELAEKEMTYLPMVAEADDGTKIAITESSLEDYPGMFLKKAAQQAATLEAAFAAYPLKERQLRDRHMEVTERADYIARTKGARSFPWRLLVIAHRDGELVESDLVYRLSDPPRISDPSWIRPGKVAWDWWNANNLYGVDFPAGINTQTYKHYIDFASRHGLEYVILDEGWSAPDDLLKINPDVDMEELFRYAAEKKVGLILWCVWLTLDRQLDAALDMFEKWGAKGIKVDFMDRDDQKIVNYYWRIAEQAARRKLLVDFHGAYKPAGLDRAYPNVLTREGVMGLEYSKWSDSVTPEHDLIIPFTRMLAGPMDYTPGAMVNAQQRDFKPIFNRPMSQGTRCHQLAMFVVFESPLQMLCDSPSNYSREPEIMDFLAGVPSVWDETKVLDAKVGDYLVAARRSGRDWYIGAMTDWSARELAVDVSFLGGGRVEADIWEDGVNASRWGSDYRKTRQVLSRSMVIKLAPGGGWVARVRR
jgi:alpha-glucosidase